MTDQHYSIVDLEKMLTEKIGKAFSIDLYNLSEEDKVLLKTYLPEKALKGLIICDVWCAFHGPIYSGPISRMNEAIKKHKDEVFGFHAIRHVCERPGDW